MVRPVSELVRSDVNEYVDFSAYFHKSRDELQSIYENKYRRDPKFGELISELFRNEIEYKFLE